MNVYNAQCWRACARAGCQLYEKMISGMYLGEIVRLLLDKLILEGHLFGGDCDSEDIAIPYRFFTKFVSEIETCASPRLSSPVPSPSPSPSRSAFHSIRSVYEPLPSILSAQSYFSSESTRHA